MKFKRFYVFFAVMFACSMLSSCEKGGEFDNVYDNKNENGNGNKGGGEDGGEDWGEFDWYPVSVFLKVTDSRGTDLFDPENPDNMIDGTTITFQGQTYEASREKTYLYQDTKEYFAIVYGLFLTKDSLYYPDKRDGYSLRFYEIDGALDMDEDLVVTLPDGTTGTIHYHCSNHNYRKGTCDRIWKFNGEEHKGNIFTFVIPD